MKKILIAFLITIFTTPMVFGDNTDDNFYNSISGIVTMGTDKNNNPIEVTDAYLKPANTSASNLNSGYTGQNGKFLLSNFPKNDALIVSYQQKTATVSAEEIAKNPTNLNINIDSESIDELTVNNSQCNANELNATTAERNIAGYCEPAGCIDGYILETNNITKHCTPCTAKVPNSTVAVVVGNACYATGCKSGFSPHSGKCLPDCQCGYKLVGSTCEAIPDDEKDCEPDTDGATAGVLDCRDGVSYCRATACDAANGYELADDTCTAPGFEDKGGKCTPRAVLSANNYQNEIRDLAANAQKMRDKETSDINKAIGAVGIGTVGIGGTMIGGALAERAADITAEQEMTGYLESFRCDYGSGRNITGGETNVELPGGNDMISLYTEYAQLANDLKIRKEALGIRPGIESEIVIDKAETGLYEYSNNGITGGTYASIARALLNPDGEDAAMWAAQRAATDSKLKTGAIVAGAGAAASLAANIAVNYNNPDRSKQIIGSYIPEVRILIDPPLLDQPCPDSTTGTKHPDCKCTDKSKLYDANTGTCVPCPSNKVINDHQTQCDCPNGTTWNDSKQSCITTACEPQCTPSGNLIMDSSTCKCSCINNFIPNDASKPTSCTCPENTYKVTYGQCVKTTPQSLTLEETVSLPNNATFKINSFDVSREMKTRLETFITELNNNTEYKSCTITEIKGMTDPTGGPTINDPLSEKRAKAIFDVLKNKNNIITNSKVKITATPTGDGAKSCVCLENALTNACQDKSAGTALGEKSGAVYPPCRRADITVTCEKEQKLDISNISAIAEKAQTAITETKTLLSK